MALPDFGTGLDVNTGWPYSFSYTSGLLNLGNNLCRRLQTIRGSLAWDEDCGYNIRGLLRGSLTAGELSRFAAAIGAECEKDERVEAATATVVVSGEVLRVTVDVTTAAGPFSLVLAVNDVTVELLALSATGAQ